MSDSAAHGGDVRAVARASGHAVADLIDFSANINPLGPPDGVRELLCDYVRGDWLTHYPEPGLPELSAALARQRGVRPEHIVIHAGSAALFDAILRACAPRRIGICVPAFAEYQRAAAANDVAVQTFALDLHGPLPFDRERFCRWVRQAAIDVVILTNPHNPLGFGVRAADMRATIAQLPETTFIIDEAFADFDESLSVVSDAASDPRTIVVRSLTKFYAVPDLRVGYAVMNAERAGSVARFIPAWPVSGIAAAAAAVAVGDGAYAQRTRALNALGRAQLAAGLRSLGFPAFAAAANFITFATRDVKRLRERLIADHRIIVRDCSSFTGLPPDTYVRIAVREHTENARLLAALAVTKKRPTSTARSPAEPREPKRRLRENGL